MKIHQLGFNQVSAEKQMESPTVKEEENKFYTLYKNYVQPVGDHLQDYVINPTIKFFKYGMNKVMAIAIAILAVFTGSSVQAEEAQKPEIVFDISKEVSLQKLKVTGKIPSWLDSGTLIRNSAIHFTVDGEANSHLFDGLAMIHGFSFSKGKKQNSVYYSNKFLQSDAYKGVLDGNINYRGFASDPCKTVFKNLLAMFFPSDEHPIQNANVNIAKIFDSYVALTETPLPVEFDPETLETVGVLDYQDDHLKTNGWESAHPHIDSDKQSTVNYYIKYGWNSTYNIYTYDNESKQRVLLSSIPVNEPAYMHSFALTENYIILTEFPFVVNSLDLLLKSEAFIKNFQWKPEKGTNFIVVDRHTGEVAGEYKTKPFFAFHHANAFEDEDGSIKIDVVTYDDPSVITRLSEDSNSVKKKKMPHSLERFTISQESNDITSEVILPNLSIEFPRINDEYDSKDYNYVYAAGFPKTGSSNVKQIKSDALYKIDTQTKEYQVWKKPNCIPGEPVFVKKPGATEEDDGVILSVVLDSKRKKSFLLVLDAKSFKEIARADTPHAITSTGLHGQYFNGTFIGN